MNEQTLFLAALELTGPERAAYLERACSGDANLRRHVEGLLAAHERSGEFLDEPAVAQMSAPTSPAQQNTRTYAADDNSTPGDRTVVHNDSPGFESLGFLHPATRAGSIGRLDHYEILERIGAGGFGSVFRAFDDRLHRIVAIKVLATAYAANGSARRRFIREARTAASVKNEHIVGIYDVKEDAQPPYLAMEMIDGISLQDKIDKTGPLGVKEILRIAMQTAEGLAAAHKQGLVHRDIKPSNILLENGVERVKITDFGLARAVDDASVTQSGTVAGTPMYMSPEQAEGIAIDHRSDLFSLGTVMYTMCTGHSPFRASGTHAVLKRVIEASARPIREINDEIPEWLCDIIKKLHAKKPADRFQSAKDLAELLQQHLAHLQQPHVAPLPARFAAGHGARKSAQGCEAPSVWRTTMAGAGLGMAFGLITGVIDADAMRVSGRHTPLWLNGVYFAVVGAAIGVLVGFMRILLFARIGSEIRRATGTESTTPIVPKRRQLLWDFAALLPFLGFLLFMAGGYIFSGPVKLYMLDMGEVTINDFHHDEFDGFVLVSDASPEFVNGAPLPAHTPLFVEPGTYRIRAVSKHGEKVQQWEIKNNREPLSPAVHQDGEECTLDIRRGQRVSVSVATWQTPGRSSPEPTAGSWISLFDHKTLLGWQKDAVAPGTWQVIDGVLVGSNGPSHLYSFCNDFENFHLRAEVAISKGAEADVYIRSKMRDRQPTPARSPAGYVVDLAEGKDLYTGPVSFLNPKDNSWTTQGTATTVKPDEWFTLEIYAKGNHIMTKVNGVMAVDFVDTANSFQKGNIAFDVWKPDTVLKIRKVEVRELPKTSPEVPKSAADVLPFLAGNWKVERKNLDPKLAPDKAVDTGLLVYDYVVGGKLLRARHSFSEGNEQGLFLHAFNPATNELRHWQAGTARIPNGPAAGLFNPDNHTLVYKHQVDNGVESIHQLDFVDPNTIRTRLFQQDANNTITRELRMVFTRVQGPLTLPTLPPDPTRPSEMMVLDRLVGTWRNEVTITTENAPDKPKAESRRAKAESVLGGRFVELTEANESTGGSDYSLAWYDANAKQYRRWFFDSQGRIHDFTGRWDDAAQTLTWTTPDGQTERRVIFRSDDRCELRRFVKARDGWPAYQLTGESTRVGSAVPRAVPKTAADVLPFLVGNWKVTTAPADAKLPPDTARSPSFTTFDFVAGGKFLRGRSSFAPRTGGQAADLLDLWSFESGKNTMRRWVAQSEGWTNGTVSGQFNPASHTLSMSARIADKDWVHQYEFVDSNTFNHHFFIKDASGKISSEVHHKWTRDGGPGALANLPLDPNRPAEMKVLDRLVGEWRDEAIFTKPTLPGESWNYAAREKAEPILGGRFIESILTHESDNRSDYMLAWFDPAAKQYRQWVFNEGGYFFEMTGTWTEATKTLAWKSPDGSLEGPWVFKSDDVHEFKHIVKGADGKVLQEATGVSRRIASNGFVPLFNGKDLTGWKALADTCWRVENGNLVGSGPLTSRLRTVRADFADFHFRVEMKVTSPSIVSLLIRNHEAPSALRGYKLSLSGKKGEDSKLALMGLSPLHLIANSPKPFPLDEWFKLEVIAEGQRIIVKVNDEEYFRATDDGSRTGEFAVAFDRPKTPVPLATRVEFRKIEIKELPPIKPPDAPGPTPRELPTPAKK